MKKKIYIILLFGFITIQQIYSQSEEEVLLNRLESIESVEQITVSDIETYYRIVNNRIINEKVFDLSFHLQIKDDRNLLEKNLSKARDLSDFYSDFLTYSKLTLDELIKNNNASK